MKSCCGFGFPLSVKLNRLLSEQVRAGHGAVRLYVSQFGCSANESETDLKSNIHQMHKFADEVGYVLQENTLEITAFSIAQHLVCPCEKSLRHKRPKGTSQLVRKALLLCRNRKYDLIARSTQLKKVPQALHEDSIVLGFNVGSASASNKASLVKRCGKNKMAHFSALGWRTVEGTNRGSCGVCSLNGGLQRKSHCSTASPRKPFSRVSVSNIFFWAKGVS